MVAQAHARGGGVGEREPAQPRAAGRGRTQPVAAAATALLVLVRASLRGESLVAQAGEQQQRGEARADQVEPEEQPDEQRLVRHALNVAPAGGLAVKNLRLR